MESPAIHERMLVAAAGLEYAQIAAMTGFHPERVRRYMNGDPAGAEFIGRFCAALGICADWLIYGTGPMRSAEAMRRALSRVPEADLFAAAAESVRRAATRIGEASARTQGSGDAAEGDDRPIRPARRSRRRAARRTESRDN